MKPDKKIISIVFAYAEDKELPAAKEADIEWLRININFPWKNKKRGDEAYCHKVMKK